MKHSILCIDDEPDNLDALERLFRKRYAVYKATSGDEGLAILKSQPDIAVIISDQRMPKMTGVEFLGRSQKIQPEAIRILLTGYTDVESVISAVNEGRIYRYVTKPWDPVDFVNTVDKAAERYELAAQLRSKNIELGKALSELRSLDDAKNNFMILINHELKTPLTSILSYLELLAETSLSTEQTKCVDRSRQAAGRLNRLVADSLELISAETGVLKIAARKTSAGKIIDGLEKDFAERLRGKKQHLRLDLDDADVKADAKVIRSVLNRILENAIKFSDNGAEIVIAARNLGHAVEFRVSNPGKALSSKVIAKIIQPFSIDEDIMHHSQGTGLGLAVSQALLKTHQSRLEFESARGRVEVSFRLSV